MSVRFQHHSSAGLPWEGLCTPCLGGWFEPTAGQDWGGKFRPHLDSIPGTFSL